MFESLESRQLMSATLASETSLIPTPQPTTADSQPVARKAGGQQHEYLVVTLKEVYITTYSGLIADAVLRRAAQKKTKPRDGEPRGLICAFELSRRT